MPVDIYRPGDGGKHGAMILSPGAPPLEPDDSRLTRLAGDVARAGFVMLIPYSPDLENEIDLPAGKSTRWSNEFQTCSSSRT